jgi:hypothetical protein
VSRKVLADRLDTLVREGVLERRRYQERPPRDEYVLTAKGEELMEAFFTLIGWGDRRVAEDDGPPLLLRHERCGEVVHAEVTCSSCGEPLRAGEVGPEAGPGARVGQVTRRVAELLELGPEAR